MHPRKEYINTELEKKTLKKKWVRAKEGAALYSMGLHSFQQLAKDAGATYKVKRIVLINTEIVDEFLETFREEG